MKKSLALFTPLVAFFVFMWLVHVDDTAIKHSLSKFGSNSNIQFSSVAAGMQTIFTNSDVAYVSDEKKQIAQKPMYDAIETQLMKDTNQLLMKKLNALEKEMIIYKAAQEKHVITVFTDISCGYCRKLHEQMKNYNALGITVRYLAFPHISGKDQSKQHMKAVWCSKNRKKALDEAMNGKNMQLASCNIDIENHYSIGLQFGITGTPAIVLKDGYVMLGYQGPKEMNAFLDTRQKQFISK